MLHLLYGCEWTLAGSCVPRDIIDDRRSHGNQGKFNPRIASQMAQDERDIPARRHTTERDTGCIQVRKLTCRVPVDVLQRRERVLDSDREGVFRDESVSDVDDRDTGFHGDVLADVCLCVEIAEAPSCLLISFSSSNGLELGDTAAVEIKMDRPGPWSCGLVDAHWDRVAIVTWNLGVVYFRWL